MSQDLETEEVETHRDAETERRTARQSRERAEARSTSRQAAFPRQREAEPSGHCVVLEAPFL